MNHIGISVGLLLLFSPFVLLAGRETEEQHKLMAKRFSLVKPQPEPDEQRQPEAREIYLEKQATSERLWTRVLNKLLVFLDYQKLAERAGFEMSGETFLLQCLAAQIISGSAAWFVTRNSLGTLVIGVVGGYLPVCLLRWQCRRRLQAIEVVLPQVAEMMARALRAGHSLPAALSIVAEQAPEPARQEFAELFRKQRFGLPMREALLELLARVPSQDLRVLVVGILVQRETGGNLMAILDRSSSVIRERLKLQGDVRVHTAQGRLTGWILCALPLMLFVVLHFVNPGYTTDLTNDPLGRKCLYASVGLLAVGAGLITKIVNGVEV